MGRREEARGSSGESKVEEEGLVGEEGDVEEGRGFRAKTFGLGFDSVSADSSWRKEESSWSASSSRVRGLEGVGVEFEGVDWGGIEFVDWAEGGEDSVRVEENGQTIFMFLLGIPRSFDRD